MSESTQNNFKLRLPSSLSLFYISLVFVLVASACTRREALPEESDVNLQDTDEVYMYDGQLLAQAISDSIVYIVPKQELIRPFIKEFGDGTVITKVMIHRIQDTPNDSPGFYLVGLGMHNGGFRSMALSLDVAANDALYLSSSGTKHICKATTGCGFCYFTFEGNKIVGCECDKRGEGNNCEHVFNKTNQLLKGIRLRSAATGRR
jgi:hypothetical protein